MKRPAKLLAGALATLALAAAPARATLKLTAHNAKRRTLRPKLRARCGKGKGKRRGRR